MAPTISPRQKEVSDMVVFKWFVALVLVFLSICAAGLAGMLFEETEPKKGEGALRAVFRRIAPIGAGMCALAMGFVALELVSR